MNQVVTTSSEMTVLSRVHNIYTEFGIEKRKSVCFHRSAAKERDSRWPLTKNNNNNNLNNRNLISINRQMMNTKML